MNRALLEIHARLRNPSARLFELIERRCERDTKESLHAVRISGQRRNAVIEQMRDEVSTLFDHLAVACLAPEGSLTRDECIERTLRLVAGKPPHCVERTHDDIAPHLKSLGVPVHTVL